MSLSHNIPTHSVGTEPDPPKYVETGFLKLGGTTSGASTIGFARASNNCPMITG